MEVSGTAPVELLDRFEPTYGSLSNAESAYAPMMQASTPTMPASTMPAYSYALPAYGSTTPGDENYVEYPVTTLNQKTEEGFFKKHERFILFAICIVLIIILAYFAYKKYQSKIHKQSPFYSGMQYTYDTYNSRPQTAW